MDEGNLTSVPFFPYRLYMSFPSQKDQMLWSLQVIKTNISIKTSTRGLIDRKCFSSYDLNSWIRGLCSPGEHNDCSVNISISAVTCQCDSSTAWQGHLQGWGGREALETFSLWFGCMGNNCNALCNINFNGKRVSKCLRQIWQLWPLCVSILINF